MKSFTRLSLGLAFAAFASHAIAGEAIKPVYSAEAIVEHMIKQADLGAARAICIGTKSECEENTPKQHQEDCQDTDQQRHRGKKVSCCVASLS